jgi:hypothetical protein
MEDRSGDSPRDGAPDGQGRAGRRRVLLSLAALGLAPLAARAQTAAGAAPTPPPQAGAFLLPARALERDPVTGRLVLPPDALPDPGPAAARPLIAPADMTPEAALLRRLAARGTVAGLAGVLYDNRDRGHSLMPPESFPQLTRIVYPPAMVAANLDYGLAGSLRLPAIVLGNSSTALTAEPAWRSQVRLMMTAPGGPVRAAADYAANALYLYPEHRDHDGTDHYPAAWPYTLTSQGSSGSDRPFLHAAALILAALRPDTRARLQAEGLVVPTVQMVLRRAQVGVRRRSDYLSGSAHPSAFDSRSLAPAAMVALANSLTPDGIPPLIQLAVLAEDFTPRAGLLGQSERLFDTPQAIARLWRGPAYQREMTLSASGTTDPNGRPLRFDWVLLRGDPARVTITPLDEAGTRARVTLDWHEPRPAPRTFAAEGEPPLTTRVDIGVFAWNGTAESAPAFVSVAFPTHETRRYAPAPDGTMQLAEVDYDALGRGIYFDPTLWWSAPWTDRFAHDAAGTLTGWTRSTTRPDLPDLIPGPYDAQGQRRDGRPFRYIPRTTDGTAPPELTVEAASGG